MATIPVMGLALTLAAVPAVASPVAHMTMPAPLAIDKPIVCSTHSYSFVSGEFDFVVWATGDADHVSARDVVAQDENGVLYRVVGAETFKDSKGMLVTKIVFLSPGTGAVGKLDIVVHVNLNGNGPVFYGSDCSFS